MAETLELEDHAKSLAAPTIFLIVLAFHLLNWFLEQHKKQSSMNAADVLLRADIKQLLKESNSFSQPSTFAQAAKLRRMAAAKERELAKNQELDGKEINMSNENYSKTLLISKVFTYFVLILWFWHFPVAAISEQLVQPFGKALSWRAGGTLNDNVMVGVIPWLIVSTRVSKLICRKILK